MRPIRRLKYGMHVLAEAEAERKNVVALDEERSLLGEEEREPRQVRPARVDFGFGEVGVHRRRREDIRAHALTDVEAGLKVAFDAGVGRRNAAAGGDRRPDGQPDAKIEVRKIGQQSSLARLRDLVLPVRVTPIDRFRAGAESGAAR